MDQIDAIFVAVTESFFATIAPRGYILCVLYAKAETKAASAIDRVRTTQCTKLRSAVTVCDIGIIAREVAVC